MTTIDNPPLITIDNVVAAIEQNQPNIQCNQQYTLEQLVGKARWSATHKNHRLQLGAAFKALIDSGDLPFVSAGKRSDNSQLYQKE